MEQREIIDGDSMLQTNEKKNGKQAGVNQLYRDNVVVDFEMASLSLLRLHC
jgi:hypothetical protein